MTTHLTEVRIRGFGLMKISSILADLSFSILTGSPRANFLLVFFLVSKSRAYLVSRSNSYAPNWAPYPTGRLLCNCGIVAQSQLFVVRIATFVFGATEGMGVELDTVNERTLEPFFLRSTNTLYM